ncbi:UDP-glucose 6-dehydrogenase tuaD [Bhargavaea cecembensis DSE10]|uniref:UDP-glucose 6-dehydrogenase tuaD n=1 Tax=Bhargavaea cecembensis DSE10 TaxID=1235279 RepID=M7P7S5_9BACL|nr:nucleotide sugar dehydrogenase [Bhargavaea cecembensis]EMR06574.1 UDP-glucose 6-dehydrogenase tuaD [Bhargavaea cecembensis DSE10]
MINYENLIKQEKIISIIGLGYVGLPLAIELAKKFKVIGYDNNSEKIQKYLNGIDITQEVGDTEVKQTSMRFTTNEEELKQADFHIVSVPTPINSDKTPDLKPVISASEVIGRNLNEGAIVVYESTVYPGTTEEVCIPILEKESGLKFGKQFKVGYSPERINPGDKKNTLTKIKKVVSGSDDQALSLIAKVYGEIIKAGIHKAESIKVAEAAKVIENSQRDINIAFMNELSLVFNRMNIDTKEVLKAAGTKWNFLDFKPGLVGGHCIGVDPYYFIYKAEQLGYHSQIITAGRKINDDMPKFVSSSVIKEMIKADIPIKGSSIGLLGITFKENCPDVRNTKVIDIINDLKELGVNIIVYDPWANPVEVEREYGIKLAHKDDLKNLDSIILAVGHDEFQKLTISDFNDFYKRETRKVFIDIKGIHDRKKLTQNSFIYWSL